MEPGTTTIHAPCSECGHKPGETASPRWPLWLRALPWLAVLAVIVLAAGLGLRGLQAPSTWLINDMVYGVCLREWPLERLQRASEDPAEARILRDDLLAVAAHFGDLAEPGAELRFRTDVLSAPLGRLPPDMFGMPWTWLTVHHSATAHHSSIGWSGTSLIVPVAASQVRLDLALVAFNVTLAMFAAWVCGRLSFPLSRLQGSVISSRAANRVRLVVFGMSLFWLLMIPTPNRWPNAWDQDSTLYRRVAVRVGTNLTDLQAPDLNDKGSLIAAEGLCNYMEWEFFYTDGPEPIRPYVQWINTADGTLTTTNFGTPWSLFSYGTSICDPPSSGTPTTRFGWPEWRYERLVIWAGTRGFPSRAGYIALEPAGIGIWSLFALIAYWLAALTRHLITRTILRRRQRAARCQACGYQLSIIKPAS